MKKLILAFGLIISSLHAYSQNGYSSVFLRVTDSATFVNSANTTAKHTANYADIWYSTVSGLFWKWSTVTNTYTLVGSGENIGNTDLTSTGNRIFNGGGFNLEFSNIASFTAVSATSYIESVADMDIVAGDELIMQITNALDIDAGGPITIDGTDKASITATDSINFTAPIIKLGGQVGTTGQVPTINASGKLKYATPSGGGLTTADNGLTANTATNVRLGGTLLANTAINGAFSLQFGNTTPLTLLGHRANNVDIAATGTGTNDIGITADNNITVDALGGQMSFFASTNVGFTSGTTMDFSSSGLMTFITDPGDDIKITSGNGVHVTSVSSAITDASTMDITSNKHTLTTSSATRTFTQSYLGDYTSIVVTLNATASTFTFPAGSLCVSDGIASGDNTAALAGVSGDKYYISISKYGSASAYYVVVKNFGQ